jgi:AAA+ ATPase superfamily predicted ATPase
MKFYDRDDEVSELRRICALSFSDHSRMTVIAGRRRIGKTSLVFETFPETETVYFFVGRKSEAALCQSFRLEASEKLKIYIPESIHEFSELFHLLMEIATTRAFILVIDEFQEFFNINPSVYSDMQNIWDRYRKKTKMNLIVSGSVNSLINKIFMDSKEALFGRADNIIRVSSFGVATLKEILSDLNPEFVNDDLLALYSFTGGVPKYVELLVDSIKITPTDIISFMLRENSMFIDEGRNLLIEEFGKNYAVYFSILTAISDGITTQSEIEVAIRSAGIGGHLKRLMDDYSIIKRKIPICSKPGTHAIRYEISDNFLIFWFRYIEKYRSMIEIRNFGKLRDIINKDYKTFSGHMLEKYFRLTLAESYKYREIGSWWELHGNAYELDIVAIGLEKNTVDIFEVKRDKKRYQPELLKEKADHFKSKFFPHCDMNMKCLSLEDM